MGKTNFKISITINGATGSFVFEAEKKTEIMTDNKEEAVRLFNQQWNVLASFSTPSSDGKVVITLEESSSDRFIGSWANLKMERFCLTGRLLCMLEQNGFVTVT